MEGLRPQGCVAPDSWNRSAGMLVSGLGRLTRPRSLFVALRAAPVDWNVNQGGHLLPRLVESRLHGEGAVDCTPCGRGSGNAPWPSAAGPGPSFAFMAPLPPEGSRPRPPRPPRPTPDLPRRRSASAPAAAPPPP